MNYESIIKIEKIGQAPTIDIEVNSPNHIYYANGIASRNSHACGYGIIGYQCAFAKTHFAPQSYTAWLRNANEKAKPFEEIAELVADAKVFGFDVYPPNFLDFKINFQTDGDKVLTAGLSNIKGIGEAQVKNVKEIFGNLEKDFKPLCKWNWYEFLILSGDKISKTVMEGLILTGSLRKFGELRSKMFAEYSIFRDLRVTEIEWIQENYTKWKTLADSLDALAAFKKQKGYATKSKKGAKPTAGDAEINRAISLEDSANLLRHPIMPYRDNPAEIAADEERLLGVSLTCSLADAKPGERWTTTCQECQSEVLPKNIILKVKIDDVRPYVIKKGKEENIGREMAFLKVSDGTCSLEDISCFANAWEGEKDEEGNITKPGFKNILTVGRVLEIQLDKGFKGNRLHVKNVWEI